MIRRKLTIHLNNVTFNQKKSVEYFLGYFFPKRTRIVGEDSQNKLQLIKVKSSYFQAIKSLKKSFTLIAGQKYNFIFALYDFLKN